MAVYLKGERPDTELGSSVNPQADSLRYEVVSGTFNPTPEA